MLALIRVRRTSGERTYHVRDSVTEVAAMVKEATDVQV